MSDRLNDTVARAALAHQRALATLRRAIATERRVITENQRLAEVPGHEESAQKRLIEAEQQLRAMEAELARLESGEPLSKTTTPD